MVHCGRDVAHQRHHEERHLQDGVLDEGEPVNDALVPVRALEVEGEREEIEEDSDAPYLEMGVSIK